MRLTVSNLIEYGGFCRVYAAKVTGSQKTVALKKTHVTKHVKNPLLRHEACAMLLLQGHWSVPAVYAWGRSQYYEYLAMELLGSPISSALHSEKRLTTRNLVVLVCQMFDIVEYIHSHNLVHCDIKPDNFLFALDETRSGRIQIIDFGLAKYFREPHSGEHIPEESILALRGTPLYASLNVHFHCTPSRRDDMESLAYTILKLLRGSLPWKSNLPSEIPKIKQLWSSAALCQGYPSVFADFLEYARNMGFNEMPDYGIWKQAFRMLAPGLPENPKYDLDDATGPFVGVSSSTESPPMQDHDKLRPIPKSESDPEEDIPDSDDDWMPTSSWAPPFIVKDKDLIGDEEKIVREKIERIDEVPVMDQRYLWNDNPEVMVL